MKIVQYPKRIYNKLLNTFLTRKNADGVEYIWKRHHSSVLVIVFSGMGEARYNYIRSLSACSFDQLFIRDCWAGNASYYWIEGKSNYPEIYTQSLIDSIITQGKYTNTIFTGSSKGGTAAIYYGLKNQANHVVAGACQYHVGNYLAQHQMQEHPEQWIAVVGNKIEPYWVKYLNNKLADMIESCKESQTLLHLLYSTEEHTYEEHMKPLLKKLDECNIIHNDHIESFPRHSMVGDFFKKYLPLELNTIKTEEKMIPLDA